MVNEPKSPYLADPRRLADVIAAIQAMASYRFYKQTHGEWADRIAASKDQAAAARWRTIFEEHPEFFRIDAGGANASLVWRRQFPKSYDTRSGEEISPARFAALSETERIHISRPPLKAADIKMLVDTAVSLHSRALEHQKEQRWWTALAGAGGAVVGSVIGALLKS